MPGAARAAAFRDPRRTVRPGGSWRLVIVAVLLVSPGARAEPPDQRTLEALRPLHGVVGVWKGTGSSHTSRGWTETIECTWGFREKDGRVSFELRLESSELFEAAVLTHDPERTLYRFIGRRKEGEILRFEGKPAGAQSLRLPRLEPEGKKDSFDRIEIRLLRGGDKLMYSLDRKVGRSSYESVARVELFREGPPLSTYLERPLCIVTGVPSRLFVDHQGKSYPVACAGAKSEFLAHPERYLPAAGR